MTTGFCCTSCQQVEDEDYPARRPDGAIVRELGVTTVGSQTYVNIIAEFCAPHGLFTAGAPEGWKFLGRGVSRGAYLAPDGVVYKVGSSFCNTNEHESAEIARAQGYNVPATTLWDEEGFGGPGQSVLAMGFVYGDLADDIGWDYYELQETPLAELTDDIHGANVIISPVFGPVLIDIGY